MSGIPRALALLFTKSCFVLQEIGARRGIDGRGAGPRVAGETEQPARACFTDKAVSRQASAVGKLDRFTLGQFSPEWAFGDPGRFRLLDVKASAADVLFQDVADRGPAAMLCRKGADVVAIALLITRRADRVSCLHFGDLDWTRNALDAQLHRRGQNFLGALGAVEKQRLGTALQAERADQPDDAEEVIGVKVREEDLGGREAHAVAHHLALGAFAALQQKRFALSVDSQSRNVSLDGGPGRRRAKERDG